MTARNAIDFCPAAACATDLARLEALIEITAQLTDHAAHSPDCLPLMRGLEAISEDLLLAADEARSRLSETDAVSAAGAIAQLLAAIRDIRARDDAERERAKDLEARAIRFLAAAHLVEPGFSRALSQTKSSPRPISPAAAVRAHWSRVDSHQ